MDHAKAQKADIFIISTATTSLTAWHICFTFELLTKEPTMSLDLPANSH